MMPPQTEMLGPQGLGLRLALWAPKIAARNFVVRRVEQLFAFADQIETRVKEATARVNHLTQSILAKALTRTSVCSGLRPSLRLSKIVPGNFVSGELTADRRAQNSDLISGENFAEVLLARIRAQREGGRPAKRGAPRRPIQVAGAAWAQKT